MAIDASCRSALEGSNRAHVDVTLAARHSPMFTGQRKLQLIVIELREAIGPVVTGHAIGTKIGHVLRHKIGLILAVAGFALRRIELGHIVAVASGTRKRLPVGLFLMRRQRELQTVVGKILGRDLRQRRERAPGESGR